MGVKMVLSGEGSDEIFGGYLYFHKAPDAGEFHRECIRKLDSLHLYDCNRANKSTSAWGVEVRVPFLDRAFLDEAMTVDPTVKLSGTHPEGPRIEKHYLRRAFDDDEALLPDSVLWRQKEQFSDGVGYDWVDGLAAHAEEMVSDAEFANRANRFPLHPPATKEYYLLRSIFEEHFVTGMENGDCAYATCPFGKSIACSTPEAVKWDPEWEKSVGDISGRAVNVHDSASGFVVKRDTEADGGNVASSSAKSTVSALGAVDGASAGSERRRRAFAPSLSPLRAKSANGARRSQVGFSGARADRVRGFVGSRAIAARSAFAFA